MANPRLIATATTQILKTLDDNGAKLPKSLRADLDKRLEDSNTISQYRFKEQSVAEAVHDAIAEGRDPLGDPKVQRAALARTLSGQQTMDGLSEAAYRRLGDVVTQNLDAIITALKGPFDAAGKQLTDAHATLTAAGLRGLDDPGILQSRSTEVVTAGAHARIASDTLNRLDMALKVLFGAIELRPNIGSAYAVIRFDIGDEPLSTFHGTRAVSYWDALDRGYTISLATSEEQAARIQRAEEADRTREQAAAMAEETARKSRSFVPVSMR